MNHRLSRHIVPLALRLILVVGTLAAASCVARTAPTAKGPQGNVSSTTTRTLEASAPQPPQGSVATSTTTRSTTATQGESVEAAADLDSATTQVAVAPDAGAAETLDETEGAATEERDQPEEANEQSVAAEAETAATSGSLDWTYWRGPEFNGVSRETGLVDDWDPQGGSGSNVAWRRPELGGRSTPIVMNGKLYTLVRDKPETNVEGEKVVCADAATGDTIWENRFNVWLSDVPDTRVGWSSVVGDPETNRVYALGVCGYFLCMDAETGKTLWDVPLHEKFGLLSTFGGRTNFPVVIEDLVIISGIVIGWGDMAKPSHRFIGFDKMTGDVVWYNETRLLPDDTTYSAPAIAVVGGQRALIIGAGDGSVWALQPRTGAHIWSYDFSRRGLNVSPLVVGDTVYTGQAEENVEGTEMGAVVAIDASGHGDITKSGARWLVKELMVGRSSPLLIGDRLYCIDDRAKMQFLDAKTGETVAPRKALGTVMHASPLYADGKIYAVDANGRWFIMRPDERRGVVDVSKGRMPEGEECHASPICAHGRIYIQTSGAMYCLEDKSKPHGATPPPAATEEAPVADDPAAAFVQVVPAEVLMYPGRIQNFKVRLFNSRGQFLRESDAEFELDGAGEVAADGTYLAPSDAGHSATILRAKVGQLSGRARIRVVPELPWEFTFDGLTEPPVTWVGARYRHVIRDDNGNKVMVKVTTIPKGTRSRCWFGHTELHDYTIQADVKGALTDNKMPDIGLTAQGYALDLQGAGQELQVRTWVANPIRSNGSIQFPWEPNRWYTMKLQVALEQDDDGSHPRAVVHGKVWPRDEPEPGESTITLVDESPVLTGSPGLYGNAKDAEITLDNIKVYAN